MKENIVNDDEEYNDEFSLGKIREITNEDDAQELSRMSNPVETPMRKMRIMNVQDMIFRLDNLINDQVTVVSQLVQKCSSDKTLCRIS